MWGPSVLLAWTVLHRYHSLRLLSESLVQNIKVWQGSQPNPNKSLDAKRLSSWQCKPPSIRNSPLNMVSTTLWTYINGAEISNRMRSSRKTHLRHYLNQFLRGLVHYHPFLLASQRPPASTRATTSTAPSALTSYPSSVLILLSPKLININNLLSFSQPRTSLPAPRTIHKTRTASSPKESLVCWCSFPGQSRFGCGKRRARG
jgi:hypothetical protein